MKTPKKKPVTLAKPAPPKRAAVKPKKAQAVARRTAKQIDLEDAIKRSKKAKAKRMTKTTQTPASEPKTPGSDRPTSVPVNVAGDEAATQMPANEPEPADEGAGQFPAPDAPAAAEAPADDLSDETGERTHDFDETDPDEVAARDRAVRIQVEDFVENLPPGAEEGLYSATAHDRWTNGAYQLDIPDGTYAVADAGGWALTLRAGRLYSAKHESRMTEDEARGVTLIGS